MPLTAKDIREAFQALSEELADENRRGELIIVGGAALVMLFGVRESTKDVDAYFVQPEASLVRRAAEAVAHILDLPPDWLNDGAKGYMVGVTEGPLLFESDALIVRAASLAQLLAMKLAAWRDAIDRSDAYVLLSQMSGNADNLWATIEPFVPPHQRDKASYAFEDLWESLHGHT